MRRLNVRHAQIDECIRKSMFAVSFYPQNPELRPGELLLLQLVKQEAKQSGKLQGRIDFALVFDHIEEDRDGRISRLHWPSEGRVWPWIIFGSATVPTIPFSLESLNLSRSYDGQDNARYVTPQDEEAIRPFILWSLAQPPRSDLQLVPATRLAQEFGPNRALNAIYNHDRIALLNPVPKKTVTTEQFVRNQWLADSLKSYYAYRCQVCGQDFHPTYGVRVADIHHIRYLRRGGPDVSENIVVVCPNHHRLIHATDATFNYESLAYEYPNGLKEPLVLRDHFENAPALLSKAS